MWYVYKEKIQRWTKCEISGQGYPFLTMSMREGKYPHNEWRDRKSSREIENVKISKWKF